MKHVNRLAVGGLSMTLGWVIFHYTPEEWLKAAAVVLILLAAAYLIGAAILNR